VSGKRDLNPRPSPWQSGSGAVQGVPDHSDPSPSVRVSRGSLSLAAQPSAVPSPSVPQVPCTEVDRPHTRPAARPREALLTVREVAALLRVSTATIYALAARQELPHVRVSNALRFRPEDVEQFLGRG